MTSSSRDIYQQIFDIDIAEGSGIRAITQSNNSKQNDDEGYIIVNESFSSSSDDDDDGAKSIFPTVVIPPSKQKSYDLAKKLFDNYNLRSNEVDEITAEEQSEIDDFLKFVVDRPPMALARRYIEDRHGSFTDEEWYNLVEERWFRMFQTGSSAPTRSGFEHVFLGEWKTSGSKVGGLHWWYYFLEKIEDMSYRGAKYDFKDASSGLSYPIVATMQFTWDVAGEEGVWGDEKILYKAIGGFFVGMSVEGLMAMGMVRASQGAPTRCIIEGGEIQLAMYKSSDYRSINTFFPILEGVLLSVGEVDNSTDSDSTNPPSTRPPETTIEGSSDKKGFRILSIVSNPAGHDVGMEKVTVVNMFGENGMSLSGWKVVGPNQSALTFGNTTLARGEARTFVLPGHGGTLQLSNKGGDITLFQPNGTTVEQVVTYASNVARIQDAVLIWDGAKNLIAFEEN